MGDWLKLTEEDIEQAQQTVRAAPVLTEALVIYADDLPASAPSSQLTSAGQVLQITEEDLTVVPPQPITSPNLAQLEQLMFGLINQARAAHLPGWLKTVNLRWHTGLTAVARGHSQDMQQRQYIDHTSPEGVTAAQRLGQYGITYLACGENIGIVYGPNSHSQQGIYDVHHAFMKQPRSLTNHRGNLLNPVWTHVGIGVAYAPSGVLLITQNFMSAPGAK
ncbi:MAG: CAP domain-containing protein [Ardenticatenaceae bacterium]|nr:CAP domain-containing protein [Ardenticatenaceae bacterium]